MMNLKPEFAAQALEGRILKNEWVVKKLITKGNHATGGNFSVCYIVEKDNKEAFLKAFDISAFLNGDYDDFMESMNEMTTAYMYEKDLLFLCKEHSLSKVSSILDAGTEKIKGYAISAVPYLIFELAKGDIRDILEFAQNIDNLWKLQSLHNIATGLQQLHSIEIGHQDLKPSNILIYNKNISKIGDLGRSLCKNISGPYDDAYFSGDATYAPPEIHYRYYIPDWYQRIFAIDAYLLGSMVVFYFSGITMTNLLNNYIDDQFDSWKWKGKYTDIIPYLLEAFDKALQEFGSNIDSDELRNELILVVKQLCHPVPEKRGTPNCNFEKGGNLIMSRYISKFDLLARRVKYNLIK